MDLQKPKQNLQKLKQELQKLKQDSQKTAFFENFDGIVLVNKKPGMTSFDVIRRFKRFFF
jgi:tRNA U55 pseudouridine synthase TruB